MIRLLVMVLLFWGFFAISLVVRSWVTRIRLRSFVSVFLVFFFFCLLRWM